MKKEAERPAPGQSFRPLPEFEGISINEDGQWIWFRQGALHRYKLSPENFAELYAEAEEATESKRNCPACNMFLRRHKYSLAPQVTVAECYGCGGTLMHFSELKEICENSMTQAQREAYLEQLAHSVDGFSQADHLRVTGNGVSGFAKTWQKYRFWARNKDASK